MRFAVGDEVRCTNPAGSLIDSAGSAPLMRVAELGVRLVWCEWHVGECKMSQWFSPDQLVKVRSAR